METLNSAARAAGFAMAVADENQSTVEAKPEVEAKSWRSGQPVLVHHDGQDRRRPVRKNLLDFLHRRAAPEHRQFVADGLVLSSFDVRPLSASTVNIAGRLIA
jgi:hypothetical protein